MNMIASIRGTVEQRAADHVVVMTGAGIGYAVCVKPSTLETLTQGSEVQLTTYLKVTETAMELYGFASGSEKQFFELLISVSGVGPKGALNILSLGSLDQIQDAIAKSDVAYLTQVSGIGKKTAERMIVELKSKVGAVATADVSPAVGAALSDVVEGLVAMGYSKSEASTAVRSLDPQDKSVERLLKEALIYVSK